MHCAIGHINDYALTITPKVIRHSALYKFIVFIFNRLRGRPTTQLAVGSTPTAGAIVLINNDNSAFVITKVELF